MLKNVFLDMVFSLEQSYILPLPKFQGANRILDQEFLDDGSLPENIGYWNRRLDALANDRGLWNEFRCQLNEMSEVSFNILSNYAATINRCTILHLAVLDDQLDYISRFSADRALLSRRNRFGLTALELALYLHKQKSAEILSGLARHQNFLSQPNVEFESFGGSPQDDIEFISQPVFERVQVLEEIFSYSAQAKSDDKIPNDRIWMGVYFDREIQQALHPRMKIKLIDREIGYGVFAGERILPSSCVGEYTGVIQERKSNHVNQSNYCFRYTAWPMGKRQYVIDAENMGNFTRFINHSDNPNIGLVCVYWRGMPRLIFISIKEIAEGDQLLFDYGKTFWKQCPYLMKRVL
jgi:uncharacterized protein